jgi:hypothetical protein
MNIQSQRVTGFSEVSSAHGDYFQDNVLLSNLSNSSYHQPANTKEPLAKSENQPKNFEGEENKKA